MIIYAYIDGDNAYYCGFHQNLYSPECMCTICVNSRCDMSIPYDSPQSARSMWSRVRCFTCGSLFCEFVRDHKNKCDGGESNE